MGIEVKNVQRQEPVLISFRPLDDTIPATQHEIRNSSQNNSTIVKKLRTLQIVSNIHVNTLSYSTFCI